MRKKLGGTLFIMVYAAVIYFPLFFLGTGLPNVVPAKSQSLLLFAATTLFSSALFYLGLGFAILRYRLRDIDMLINRQAKVSACVKRALARYNIFSAGHGPNEE